MGKVKLPGQLPAPTCKLSMELWTESQSHLPIKTQTLNIIHFPLSLPSTPSHSVHLLLPLHQAMANTPSKPNFANAFKMAAAIRARESPNNPRAAHIPIATTLCHPQTDTSSLNPQTVDHSAVTEEVVAKSPSPHTPESPHPSPVLNPTGLGTVDVSNTAHLPFHIPHPMNSRRPRSPVGPSVVASVGDVDDLFNGEEQDIDFNARHRLGKPFRPVVMDPLDDDEWDMKGDGEDDEENAGIEGEIGDKEDNDGDGDGKTGRDDEHSPIASRPPSPDVRRSATPSELLRTSLFLSRHNPAQDYQGGGSSSSDSREPSVGPHRGRALLPPRHRSESAHPPLGQTQVRVSSADICSPI